MAHVEFSEKDAFALMAILRDRMRRSGFAFVDDSALRFANADLRDAPNSPERERLLSYLDFVSAYFERNSHAAYRAALGALNERLDPKSDGIRGVELDVPDGTGIYSAREPLLLERVLFDERSTAEFQKMMRTLRGLVTDGWLPDSGDGGRTAQ